MHDTDRKLQNLRRLDRQFARLERLVPFVRSPLSVIRAKGWWVIRVPVAFLLIAGGILSILPILGLWMLPTGLLLLAIDLPVLRRPLSALMIRGRRRFNLWRRQRRR